MRSSLDLFKWSLWLAAACAFSGCARQPVLQTAAEAERLDSVGLLSEADSGKALLLQLPRVPVVAATVQADGAEYSVGPTYDAASGLRCRKILAGPSVAAGRVACEANGGWQWAAPVVEEGGR